ncbi:Uncharacterised protein [Candidatus Tiddalikarchaeum anstoanum]|nr:Uncharacterised protein [Candidatus Tiddalikarchaeum anstoanum]
MADDEKKEATEEEIDEAAENLAFTNAEIVRLIKKNLPEGRMIKKRVKTGMNKFLEEVCIDVCKKLAKEPYAYIEYDMLERAIRPYKDLHSLEVEKERLIASLNKIKADCEVMVDDINRKFSIFEDKDKKNE